MSFYGKLRGDDEGRIESIRRNLEASFGAKRGYAASVEVFGVGSYDGYFSSKARIDALVAEMLEVVRAFEPRLLEPAMTLLGRDPGLWLRFSLTGKVGRQPVSFIVLVHGVFRHVRVESA